MNKQQLANLFEAAVSSTLYYAFKDGGCTLNIEVADDLVPRISVDTNDDRIHVSVDSRPLQPNGWEFIPRIITEALDEKIDLERHGEISYMLSNWAKIAQACDQLYEFEFYPDSYIY